MLIRQTPKNKDNYIIINNKDMIYELALIGVHPKYIDEFATYFVKSRKLEKYLYNREKKQWLS